MRKVAESTVRRLSLYLRFLEEFEDQGIETVSSGALASRGGTTSAQVRKDLSFFGSFGKRGLGYPVPELANRLREILGLKRRYRVGMIGAGKIGSALVQYRGFKQRGFDIVAIFDSDAAKIGRQWNGLTVLDIASLEKELARQESLVAQGVTTAQTRDGRLQVTVVVPLHEPWLGVATFSAKPAARGWVRTIPLAASGPALATVRV